MAWCEILNPECVKVPLEADEKHQAIAELVAMLDGRGLIDDYDAVLNAVEDRELIRSTGIGQGFAIPHGKTAAVDRLVMAVGKTKRPIDFDSIDGRPVSVIVLLVSPQDQTGPHILALAQVSRMMLENDLRGKIWDSQSPKALFEVFCENLG
jgi:fructose-specific phosphotransferase system IIA component